MGKVSSFCFKTITITACTSTFAPASLPLFLTFFFFLFLSIVGKSHTAQIVDACPSENGGCQYGSLDMSPLLFNYFSTPDAGVFQMSWTIGGDEPTTTTASPTPTTVVKTTSAQTTSTPIPTTSTTPTSTYTPPTTTSLASSTSSSSPSPTSSISTTIAPLNSTLSPFSGLTNSTLSPNATSQNANAPESTTASLVHPSGNLDRLSQIVLGLGGLLGASAMDAKNHPVV